MQSVNGTIVECNTAYGGSRSQTAMHCQAAEDHGFTAIADFKILDEGGSMTLPVEGGSVLTENYVGAAFADYDSCLVLSHFKGHMMAGFGGAIKNISIGPGSQEGRLTAESMSAILSEEKSDLHKITLTGEKLGKTFPKSYTPRQMEETILNLLERWCRQRQRAQER